MQFRELTGREPPPTLIDTKAYTQHGFPWFDLYDEGLGDVAAPEDLAGIKSVWQKDTESGRAVDEVKTEPDEIPPSQVKKIRRPGDSGRP